MQILAERVGMIAGVDVSERIVAEHQMVLWLSIQR